MKISKRTAYIIFNITGMLGGGWLIHEYLIQFDWVTFLGTLYVVQLLELSKYKA